MTRRLQALTHVLKARLSRRIVRWTFLSIVIIEAIILVPSVYRRQGELLNNLQDISKATITGILMTEGGAETPGEILERLQMLPERTRVVGGALYDANLQVLGTFGEPPNLKPDINAPVNNRYWRSQARYDCRLLLPQFQGRYVLVVRQDATQVEQELIAFVFRIGGLVLIISVFVTGATMLVLEPTLISPILQLRSDLIEAGHAVRDDRDPPDFASTAVYRQDELGEVVTAFEAMFNQVSEAIAERKQSEAALRQSETRFRTLVEQAADAFFIVNAQGGIIDVNQEACRNLGYTRAELMQLTVPDIQVRFTPEAFGQLWQSLKPGEATTIEGIHRRKDGSMFPVEVRVGVLETTTERLLLALSRDITERKQAEKAMADLAEIGELAAMIVHEVRNPLTTVLMGLNSFKRIELPERSQMRLGLALDEAERLQRLLNEILQYARHQTLERSPLELNAWMTEILGPLQDLPFAAERTIALLPSATPAYTAGDRDKLKQVMINLVSNACEAIAPGDVVTCRIDCLPQEGKAQICVHNEGEPIPLDVLPNLTRPFFTTKSSGNGLGLAITRKIVEAHGGQFSIESTAEVGTLVTVILPLTLP